MAAIAADDVGGESLLLVKDDDGDGDEDKVEREGSLWDPRIGW